MPIERRLLLTVPDGQRGAFQEALLAAGLVDQLVEPLPAEPGLVTVEVGSDNAVFALTTALLARGFHRPGVRRYWRATDRELRSCELLVMTVWAHATGLARPRRDHPYDRSAACQQCGSGLRSSAPLRLRRGEVPKRGLLGSVSGGLVIVHDDLAAALRADRISGVDLERTLDPSGQPLPWHELRVTHALPAMRVETTGMLRGRISGERPCARCGRDGWFDDPEQPFTPVYDRSVLQHAPDVATTCELFGAGQLREPFHASVLAYPRLMVRQRVYQFCRRLKLRGVRFSPVALA